MKPDASYGMPWISAGSCGGFRKSGMIGEASAPMGSTAFSALAAAQWRIFVRHAIAASAIAPTYARTRLGVERSASLIGVTKAVSVGRASAGADPKRSDRCSA